MEIFRAAGVEFGVVGEEGVEFDPSRVLRVPVDGISD